MTAGRSQRDPVAGSSSVIVSQTVVGAALHESYEFVRFAEARDRNVVHSGA